MQQNRNLIATNFAREKQSLIKSVWRYLTDDHKATIQTFVTEQDNLQKGITGIEQANADVGKNIKTSIRELKN